jgi:hypothetical protein
MYYILSVSILNTLINDELSKKSNKTCIVTPVIEYASSLQIYILE